MSCMRLKIVVALLVAASCSSMPEIAIAAGKLNYGSRAGMQVTIISIDGINTSNAIIRTKHSREDATAFCREYIGQVSEKCINDELAVRLSDEITADCKTGRFSNFFGEAHQFLGESNAKSPFAPKYRIKDAATGRIADGSSASGYDRDLEIFKALCPSSVEAASFPPAAAHRREDTYIGNWYVSDPAACKDRPGQSAELVTYSKSKVLSPDTTCDVRKVQTTDRGWELTMFCVGEGLKAMQKETVSVINNVLTTTYLANGRRRTDTYRRCQ